MNMCRQNVLNINTLRYKVVFFLLLVLMLITAKRFQSSHDDKDLTAFPLVMSPLQEPHLVVFNRVSKCASSTVIWITKELGKRIGYVVVSDYSSKYEMFLSEKEKLRLVQKLSNLSKNTIYIRHLQFVNFLNYVDFSPVYVNVIRHPIDRFISRFYYARFGFMWRKKEKSSKKNSKFAYGRKMNMTLEECVLGGLENCLKAENYKPITAFFCGDQSENCRKLTKESIEKAKTNAVKFYAAIGLTEELENTLKVFGALLPNYFKGSDKLLSKCPETIRTKTKHKEEPSEHVKAVLREGLRYEIEFYEFVKERFYKQLNALREAGKL